MLYDDKFKGNILEDTYKQLSVKTKLLSNQSKYRIEELQVVDKNNKETIKQ